MKNDKNYNYRRQNIEISRKNQRTSNFTSPKKNEVNKVNETSEKTENLTGNNLLENTLKYLEMSNNGNNNYILDNNNNYIIPGLNEEYDITKKYTDSYHNNSLNYGYYTENNIKNENENGNEKLHKVKDEYIDYLQRQLEENNKNVVKLESKLTDLQKKYKNLIDDNRVLSENLNEMTSKLKESITENENLRLQINNYIDNETKYKLQFEYYEKQINMYEKNINDYNNVINDLKISNEKLTNDLSQNDLDKNLKSNNENGKNITNTNNTNNNFNSYNYFNVKNIHTGNNGELQLIKNQNMIYENDIKSKDYTIDLITKKNQKLMTENKIYKTQVKQYANQIMNLYNILKQKNKIISVYKQQEGIIDNNSLEFEFEKKMEEFNLNFISNNELFTDITNDDFVLPNMNKIDYNINNDNLNKIDKPLDLIESRYLQIMKEENNNNVGNNKNINIINSTDNKDKDKENDTESNIQQKNNTFINHRRKNKNYNNNNIIITSQNKKEEKNIIQNKEPKIKKAEETEDKANGLKVPKGEKQNPFKKTNNIKTLSGLTNNKNKHISFKGLLDTKEEMKETKKEIGRKKNLSHVPKKKKKFKISEFLDVTEINTSSPVAAQNLSFSKDDSELLESNTEDYMNITSKKLYLFGINREDYFFIFDLKEKKLSKKEILDIEDISDTFKQDYQYEGSILYNTLTGLFLLTGKKSDILYYYNPKYDTWNKICKFNYEHDNGCLLLDKEYNRIFVFGGKNTKKCEYYSFTDKTNYNMPDLVIDRANGSFIICNGKIYGFFGFSYKNNKYCGNIEYIDLKKLDKWNEVKNMKILDEKININFDIESVSTINYNEDNNKILIYCGIQGENEDYIIDYYYLYDTKENSLDLIDKWHNNILKYVGNRWRNSTLSKKDPQGYHFAKNSNFLKLPKKAKIDDYEGEIYLMMDYRNNVHFIDQEQKLIDVYKNEI